MHLNANTATRSFRELVFDLNAFLTAFQRIRPVDGESADEGCVEIDWSDGSVDYVLVLDVLKYLTYHYVQTYDVAAYLFSRLDVGGVGLIPSTVDVGSPYYSRNLSLFVENGPLSARIHLVVEQDEGTGLRISDSHISQLEADAVELPSDAVIRSLDTDDVSSDSANLQAVRVTNRLTFRTGIVTDLDVHGIRLGSRLLYPVDRVDASDIVDMAGISGPSKPNGFKLSGPMRFSRTAGGPLQTLVASNRTTVSVDVPVKITNGYRYYTSVATSVPQDISAPFPSNSTANIVMLYPFVRIIGYSEMKDVRIHLEIPESTDDGRVVQVNNPTAVDIRVCNAWMFSSNGNLGVVQSLNFMTLPAYTTVDFIVRLDTESSGLRVYMLPTTGIV